MSLKIADLNLQADLRSIVADLNSTEVYLVRYQEAESSNPYELPSATPEVIYSGPAISFKQLSAEQSRYQFGSVDANYYRCKIATPEPAVDLQPGLYGVFNFSDGAKLVIGVLERVETKLSSLITLYLNAAENVPFTLEEAGIVL